MTKPKFSQPTFQPKEYHIYLSKYLGEWRLNSNVGTKNNAHLKKRNHIIITLDTKSGECIIKTIKNNL